MIFFSSMNLDIQICFCNFAVMKMTFKSLVAQSRTFFEYEHGHASGRSRNDEDVVFHSAMLLGSKLCRRDNKIMMGRNALPLWWYSDSRRSDCAINSGLKKALLQINVYVAKRYGITPGRIKKILEILRDRQEEIPDFKSSKDFNAYLDSLNDRRDYALKEMTDIERYDFSFDVLYELSELLQSNKGGGRLARLVMYWIQKENGLVPIAIDCDRDTYSSILDSADKTDEPKKCFRKYMREMADSYLKKFISGVDVASRQSSRDRILELINKNPNHTARTMAVKLGISKKGVEKQIAILKAEKRLVRIGSDRSGIWMAVNP